MSKVTFMETPHRPLIEHLSLLSAVSIKKVISFQILMMFYVIGPDPPTVKTGKETKPASLSVFRFLAQRAGKVFSLRFQLVYFTSNLLLLVPLVRAPPGGGGVDEGEDMR